MNIAGLWDGSYGLSSLSEKTRESNHFSVVVIKKTALSPQSFKVRLHDREKRARIRQKLERFQ